MAKQKERVIVEFSSIDQLAKYIDKNKENNKAFEGVQKMSNYRDSEWCGTKNFNEALELLVSGWHTEAKVLNDKLKELETKKTKIINEYNVQGFQVSVPRYLQGLPTNMINSKRMVQQQKIVTLVKDITYASVNKASAIEKASVEVLHKVRTLEAAGQKVNLYIIYVVEGLYQEFVFRLKIKSANERLNVSKVAFPLVHPSMLRRIIFRVQEVEQKLTDKQFTSGYGHIPDDSYIESLLKKGEIFVPKGTRW